MGFPAREKKMVADADHCVYFAAQPVNSSLRGLCSCTIYIRNFLRKLGI